MSMKWLAIALLPAVAGAWSWNQEKTHSKESRGSKSGLVRVQQDDAADRDEDADDERFDRDAWKKKLTTGDLEEREQAFDELARTARANGAAREALEAWSKSGDSELAWTSRLLLRDVQRAPRAFAFGGPHSGQNFWRGSVPHGGRGNGFGIDFDDFAQRFEDLDSMFGDLRAQWDDMLRSMPAPSGGASSSETSISLQSGPDGVSCTITEKVDGKDETKTYEAKSMDELLEAHPELRDRLGGDDAVRVYGLGPRAWTMPSLPDRFFRAPSRSKLHVEPFLTTPKGHGEPRTDVLGIDCMQADEGLAVEGVHENTIASLIGLREGDVVVEINGTQIRERGDVKRVLSERASDADVSVVVVGKGGARRTLTWKPKT